VALCDEEVLHCQFVGRVSYATWRRAAAVRYAMS